MHCNLNYNLSKVFFENFLVYIYNQNCIKKFKYVKFYFKKNVRLKYTKLTCK